MKVSRVLGGVGVALGAVAARDLTQKKHALMRNYPVIAHARYWLKKDEESLAWLRESYRAAAREFTRFQVKNSRAVFGRDIHHVMLLHLGSFSSHILPDLFQILDEEGFDIVTLEEAQKDPAYDYDPDVAAPRGGTLVELAMEAKKTPWPPNQPSKPRERLVSICN